MVSKAINEGLLAVIQGHVSNDINNRIVMEGPDAAWKVTPQDVYVLSFSRIGNNWKATATAEDTAAGVYELVHDGMTGKTLAKIYMLHTSYEAIL